MKELLLDIAELQISISILNRTVEGGGGPYLDWLKCAVKAKANSFSGSFNWNVMPGELLSLSDNLMELYNQFPNRGNVEFESLEPNVKLTFTIGTRGELDIAYSFRDEFIDPTKLEGKVSTDQNVLIVLSRKLRNFIESLEPPNPSLNADKTASGS